MIKEQFVTSVIFYYTDTEIDLERGLEYLIVSFSGEDDTRAKISEENSNAKIAEPLTR